MLTAPKKSRINTVSEEYISPPPSPLGVDSPRSWSVKGHESPRVWSPASAGETYSAKLQNGSTKPSTSSSPGEARLSPRGIVSSQDSFSKTSPLEDNILTSSPSSGKKTPLDMLCRVFPHMKRGILQVVLQSCNNDLVQAIEQILNNHGGNGVRNNSFLTGNANSSVSFPLSTANLGSTFSALQSGFPGTGFLPQAYLPSTLGPPTLKSAFSPISSPPTAHLNSIRYTYSAAPGTRAAGLATALAIPYPPLLPSLTLGSGYAYSSLSNANKVLHYAISCSCCPPKSYTSPAGEKAAGCMGN